MIDDCWNKIGVRGDGSCPELKRHAHCRNCPVYGSAAGELLRTAARSDSLEDRANHFAQAKQADRDHGETTSVLVFRVGAEWLALPTTVVSEVASPKPVHSLPHRTAGVVLGITNVRGELLVSVSLGAILGLQMPAAPTGANGDRLSARLLVLRRDQVRVVCPVDEVHGVQRYQPAALKDVPVTLAKAASRYSTKLLPWDGRSVGVLDDQLLFYTVRRSVA